MKAITLWQPYAGAMALGLKRNETRPRRFNYRGDVAIHAAKEMPRWRRENDPLNRLAAAVRVGIAAGHQNDPGRFLSYGAILCVVEVYECVATHEIAACGCIPGGVEGSLGDYSPGRFAILTRNLRVLRHPVPCRGFQATPWTVPPEIEARVRAELEAHQAEVAR